MLGWPRLEYRLIAKPVELHSLPGLEVFAQPLEDETLAYACSRLQEMQYQHGAPKGNTVDVAIESGAFRQGAGYIDQAVVLVFTRDRGEQLAVWSQPVAFPQGTVEEALRRRASERQITAGQIIRSRHPQIPANNWQQHFPPYLSRHRQISAAVQEALRAILS
jgi:non-canonical (house-cleaning) NTP pyrophosphatase